ncbi:hypothetical protein ACVNP3_03900 [Pseudomonas chlororaphis subsp. piscium]
MNESNNPVGKLLRYVEEAVKIDGSVMACDGWARVLGCKGSDTLAIARGISDLYELVEASRKAIKENVKGDLAIYLAPLTNVHGMLTTCALNNQWQVCKQHLNVATIQGLVFGNHTLCNYYPAADSETQQKILAFTQQLEELLKECLESDLSEDLKALFTKHLEAIRSGLLNYLVGGPDKLEELTDQAVGAISRNLPAIEKASPEGKGVAKKIIESISFVNQVITKTQELATLASPVVEKLLPLIS